MLNTIKILLFSLIILPSLYGEIINFSIGEATVAQDNFLRNHITAEVLKIVDIYIIDSKVNIEFPSESCVAKFRGIYVSSAMFSSCDFDGIRICIRYNLANDISLIIV